ncbi:HIT family protein [Asanoa sp. NPDC049573]|uniref:HIT family protein n=1 Tax=Asanoa sp. NPDC049573 TaxID=3155396 RepID=UPI0034442185
MTIPFDAAAYEERVRTGPCFICASLRGDADYRHHVFYEDEICVAFLNRFPPLLGYSLVVPRAHVVDVTGDRALFRHLTDVVYDVAEALKLVVPTERIYLMSLGSQQGNAHVHWHVAPLPPGTPYEKQQFAAVQSSLGVLPLTEQEQSVLAAELKKIIALAAERREQHSR